VTTNLQAFGLDRDRRTLILPRHDGPSDLVRSHRTLVVDKTQGVIGASERPLFSATARSIFGDSRTPLCVLASRLRATSALLWSFTRQRMRSRSPMPRAQNSMRATPMKTAKTGRLKNAEGLDTTKHKTIAKQTITFAREAVAVLRRTRVASSRSADQSRRRCSAGEGTPGCRTGGANSTGSGLNRPRHRPTSKQRQRAQAEAAGSRG